MPASSPRDPCSLERGSAQHEAGCGGASTLSPAEAIAPPPRNITRCYMLGRNYESLMLIHRAAAEHNRHCGSGRRKYEA
eukprot:scaffold2114_cov95-Isochrysis_galbana.AAC.8